MAVHSFNPLSARNALAHGQDTLTAPQRNVLENAAVFFTHSRLSHQPFKTLPSFCLLLCDYVVCVKGMRSFLQILRDLGFDKSKAQSRRHLVYQEDEQRRQNLKAPVCFTQLFFLLLFITAIDHQQLPDLSHLNTDDVCLWVSKIRDTQLGKCRSRS